MSTDERETPTIKEQPAPTARPGESIVGFWLAAWAGTAAAGGVFGILFLGFMAFDIGFQAEMLLAVFFAVLYGAVYAGLFAIPIHATIAILTWAFWLQRFRLAAAAMAGAVTGVVAVFSLMPWGAVVTGPLGAIGAAAFGYLYIKRRVDNRTTVVALEKAIWQFTIRDLLVRMTVLAILTSAWTWGFKTAGKNRERQREQEQRWEEQSRQAEEDRLREEAASDADPLESEDPATRQSPESLIDPES